MFSYITPGLLFKILSKIALSLHASLNYPLDFTISAPELVDNLPANTTALADSQVVLQCRVQSKVQPSIKWFRKQDQYIDIPFDDNTYNSRLIQYFENTYELLESAGEKELTEDTYLSKLILNNVSERDIGVYVCVGINYRGFKLGEAYLNIIYPDDYEMNDTVTTNNFYVLFLIPIGLAIVPIGLWCIYLFIKHLSTNHINVQMEKQQRKIKKRKCNDTKYTEMCDMC